MRTAIKVKILFLLTWINPNEKYARSSQAGLIGCKLHEN